MLWGVCKSKIQGFLVSNLNWLKRGEWEVVWHCPSFQIHHLGPKYPILCQTVWIILPSAETRRDKDNFNSRLNKYWLWFNCNFLVIITIHGLQIREMEFYVWGGTLGIAFYMCTREFSSYIIHCTVRIKSFSVGADINCRVFLVNETYLRYLLTELFSNRKAVALKNTVNVLPWFISVWAVLYCICTSIITIFLEICNQSMCVLFM